MATETSCETNGAEQEKSMADWSPAGKTYIHVASDEVAKQQGSDYWVNVIHFIDDTQVEKYNTPNKDLTYNRDYNNYGEFNYAGEYPRYEFFGKESGISRFVLKFSDQNTCKFATYEEIYTLFSE